VLPDQSFVADEVIRPAAILSEHSAREVVAGLGRDDARSGGRWTAVPGTWRRWERPWPASADSGEVPLIGSVSCVYDSPRKYEITLYRAAITAEGLRQGWTVDRLCDEALSHADLSLGTCPRADLLLPPGTFRFRE
jgi:hypothetical protein